MGVKDNYIVFLDSGVGGLTYLSPAVEKLPDERFVYVADNANFPYGGRSYENLTEIVFDVTARVVDAFDPKAVVIACNTASVVTLSALREKFGIPFVGVVPAIKPAAGLSKSAIGLLATEATVNSRYTDDLIAEFAGSLPVKKFAGIKIVDFVENDFMESSEDEIISVLRPAADFFIREKIDSLVLGCTHFLFVKKQLEKLMGPGVRIVDSVEGVVNQLARIIDRNSPGSGSGDSIRFFLTGDNSVRDGYDGFMRMFGLEWGGVL